MIRTLLNTIAVILVSFIGLAHPGLAQNSDSGFVPLFNGKNLDGWKRINTAESTWSVKDGMLICTGKPIGELRTLRMYQNFILEVEWRHMKPKGNAGIFIWADDITARGVPFHRGIEIQVLENAYGNTRGYTTHGDIFPIHGATMKPINGRGGKRAFPTENRSNPTPQWNHYRIEANQGNVSLAVNGKVVTRGTDCSPRKGYICLESEGGIVHYRNLRIKVLPDTPVADQHVAIADRGYRSLYDGLSLQNWDVTGDWKSNDWRLVHSGSQPGSLTSEELKAPRGFIVDFRSNDNLPTFQFHGQSIAPASFDDQAISKKNGWNRLQVDLNKGTLNIQCNGKKPIKPIPVNGIQTPKTTRLMIQATGPTEFANIYVR